MGLRINTNIPAMNALRNLSSVDNEMNTSITRLGTGLRINSALDDPAGLIVSEGMRSQLRGIGQAMRNTQDAISMTKTAEGALDEVQRLLRDIRALAVHSANSAVVDSSTLQANQTQIRSTLSSIDRIAKDTAFGKKRLLDGTAGIMANITAPTFASSIYMGSTFAGETLQTGAVTISKVTAADQAIITMGKGFSSSSALITTSGSIVVNGFSISTDGTETVQSLVGKINDAAGTTGVTAQLVGTTTVTIVLRQVEFGAGHQITLFDSKSLINNVASANDAGTDGVFNVTALTDSGLQTVTFTGGRASADSGLKLTDNYGNVIVMTETGNANITTATSLAQVTANNVRFQIGPNGEQSTSFGMPVVFANRLGTAAVTGKTLADLDVTTTAGATEAMKIIDNASEQLAQLRGELGSFQKNFLESTSRSLEVANENLSSSESNIRDADMASEMTTFTRLQILKQSGISVLAQANQQPNSILSLLRGQ
ncbi:MAG: flagellin [Fimbriimonadaceae bacterium]